MKKVIGFFSLMLIASFFLTADDKLTKEEKKRIKIEKEATEKAQEEARKQAEEANKTAEKLKKEQDRKAQKEAEQQEEARKEAAKQAEESAKDEAKQAEESAKNAAKQAEQDQKKANKLAEEELKQAEEERKKAEEARKEAEEIAFRKDVLGYWWMYDLFAKEPSGMMYLYEYKGKVYGRTVFSYADEKDKTKIDAHNKPLAKSEHIKGEPYLMGMDMMWNLSWNEKKKRYKDGFVLDPRKKKPYMAEIWNKEDGLNMKGKVKFLGMTFGGSVTWKKATVADLPAGVEPYKLPLTPYLWYPVKEDVVNEDID